MRGAKRPIRTCVACRSSSEKKELLRIVRSATGDVAIDPTGKRPGRGAYVCRRAECVALAVRKKGLQRALRTAVSAELVAEIEQAVRENQDADRQMARKSHGTLKLEE